MSSRIPDSVRKKVNARDHKTCAKCGYNGDAVELHHITPVADGGESSVENLITLCVLCHAEWTWGVSAHEDMDSIDWFIQWLSFPVPAVNIILKIIDQKDYDVKNTARRSKVYHWGGEKRWSVAFSKSLVAIEADRRLVDDNGLYYEELDDVFMAMVGMSWSEIVELAGHDINDFDNELHTLIELGTL